MVITKTRIGQLTAAASGNGIINGFLSTPNFNYQTAIGGSGDGGGGGNVTAVITSIAATSSAAHSNAAAMHLSGAHHSHVIVSPSVVATSGAQQHAHNLSELCLTEAQMEMARGDFERYLQRYFFPCIAIFGILGNTLNLTVLLNRRMRSRANTFLAMLAIADICFLALLLPNVLANYGIFAFNYYFRYFYLNSKVHLLTVANWSSAVAIWCVIAVCADRLIGIRHPLYARSHGSSSGAMCFIIVVIVIVPGIFTFYQHFAYKCIVRSYCHGTQLYSKCLPINQEKWPGNLSNPYSPFFRKFIDINILLNVVVIIICPIIILTILNMLLLCALRQRTTNLLFGGEELTAVNGTSNSGSGGNNGGGGALNTAGSIKNVCSNSVRHHKTEQRVTLTVTLIVTMFTLTNGPSAVVHLLQTVFQSQAKDWYDITLLCSALVIIGKASNFILFCLCSKHFRNRLFNLAQKKVHEKLDSRRRSSTTIGVGHMSFGPSSRKNTPAMPKYSAPSTSTTNMF